MGEAAYDVVVPLFLGNVDDNMAGLTRCFLKGD